MRNIFFMCLLGLFHFTGFAQVITFRDISSNEVLSHVYLISENGEKHTISNLQGQADISMFRESETITIRRLGYRTETLSYQAFIQLPELTYKMHPSMMMDAAVISATRWAQSGKKTPSKISIIDSQLQALMNPQTAADLLGISGEVFIQKSQQGGGSPMIRGFATNRLLYAVDGVRMNTAIFRAGNIQNVISLDPFAMEQTEILFGPASVMYGSDAIGGVMSFQTLTPQLSINDKTLVSGKAAARFSSANNEKTYHVDVNAGWKKWALLSSLSYSNYGNLKMGSKGPDEYLKRFYVTRIDSTDKVIENSDPEIQKPTGYEQINIMQKLKYQPNKHLEVQYAFHYSETSEYSRYDRLLESQSNGLPAFAVWNYGPQIWMMNHLQIKHSKEAKFYDHLALNLAFQNFEESRIDRRFNGNRLRTQVEKVKALSANVDFEKRIGKNQLYYGLEYVLNDVFSRGSAINIIDNSILEVPDRYPVSQWSSYGVYLNYQLNISENWLLRSGLRYNVYELSSDFSRQLKFYPFDFKTINLRNGSLTGSLGLVFSPSGSWKLSINGNTGFKAPNVDDIGKIFEFNAGETVVPNPNLNAEYAYNAEINIAKTFGELARLDLSAFYTYLDGAMVRRTFQVDGKDSIEFAGENAKVYAIQNAAFSQVYGVNMNFEIRLLSGFGFSAKLNYQLGTEEMDNGQISRSRHAAPAFGQTAISYKKRKLVMQVYLVFCDEVSFINLNEEERQKPAIYAIDSNGNPFSPAWYTLNLKALYKVHSNVSVSAGIENLSDQRYRPYSSGLVAPGRNFVISLNADF